MKFKKAIRLTGSLLLFAGILLLIKHLSGVMEKDTLRPCRGMDELKKNLEDVLIPTYFPEFLAWPPSRIIAQKKPYRAMAMELKDKNNNIALVLIESEREEFRIEGLSLRNITETLSHNINGRKAILRVGNCTSIHSSGEIPCSELTWKEGRYFINITIRSGPFELLKIAESIIH